MSVSELIDLLAHLDPDKEIAVMGGVVTGVKDLGPEMAVLELEYA